MFMHALVDAFVPEGCENMCVCVCVCARARACVKSMTVQCDEIGRFGCAWME